MLTLKDGGPFADALVARGIDVRHGHVRSRFDVRGIRDAVAIAGRELDLVVSQGLDAQIVGALVARRVGVPLVTIHHKQPELGMSWHRRALTRLVARRIDRVIAVTDAQVPDLVAHGFAADRIEVIPNGVPRPEPTRDRAASRSTLELGADDFVALLVAALRPEKRAALFVAAVESAAGHDARIRGLVAGDGPDHAAVAETARSAVRVLGARSDVADLIEACDVVCLTSSAEALPMVVLEAMAGGRPVVVTDVGGVATVVEDGRTGRLLPADVGSSLEEALLDLARDPAAVSAMGAEARSRYEERYSSDRMADLYALSFRRLVGE